MSGFSTEGILVADNSTVFIQLSLTLITLSRLMEAYSQRISDGIPPTHFPPSHPSSLSLPPSSLEWPSRC